MLLKEFFSGFLERPPFLQHTCSFVFLCQLSTQLLSGFPRNWVRAFVPLSHILFKLNLEEIYQEVLEDKKRNQSKNTLVSTNIWILKCLYKKMGNIFTGPVPKEKKLFWYNCSLAIKLLFIFWQNDYARSDQRAFRYLEKAVDQACPCKACTCCNAFCICCDTLSKLVIF